MEILMKEVKYMAQIEAYQCRNTENEISYTSMEQEGYRPLVVMKFGGTSVGSAQAIEETIDFINHHKKDGKQVIVVVSAMSGVTNSLMEISHMSLLDDASGTLEGLKQKHYETLLTLNIPSLTKLDTKEEIDVLFDELYVDIQNQEMSNLEREDRILSYGERLSARLVAVRLGFDGEVVDSSEIITTDASFGNAIIDLYQSHRQANERLMPLLASNKIPVVTGFIGATNNGKITTLGRNSSDYSAAVIASFIGAEEVWICKDVYGIYTADPRKDDTAVFIPLMTQDQAMAHLEQVGDTVLCRKALEQLYGTNIVLKVRSVHDYEDEGTVIWQ